MDSHSFSLLDPDPRRKKNTEKCKEIGVADPDPVALFCLILDNNLFMFGSGHNHPITCNIICPVSGPVISKLYCIPVRYHSISHRPCKTWFLCKNSDYCLAQCTKQTKLLPISVADTDPRSHYFA